MNKTKWILWGLMMSPLYFVLSEVSRAIDPYDIALELTGTWMVVCLVIALLSGPVGRLLKQPQAWIAKQPLGLASFTWAIVHVSYYFYYNQSPFLLASIDILLKPSVLMGGVAFIILMKLALTSYKSAIKYLGKRWNVLHSTVIVATLLGGAHGLSFQKTTLTDGALMSLLLLGAVLTRYLIEFWRTKK